MTTDDERTAAVLEANEAFYRAFNTKDPDAMDAAWAAEHEVACIHPGWNALLGRDDVLASWHSILANPNQPRIVIGGAQVILTGDTAIVLCRELVAGSPLIATNVFVQETGAWKLVHHHSGGVAPGMTLHPVPGVIAKPSRQRGEATFDTPFRNGQRTSVTQTCSLSLWERARERACACPPSP